MKQKKIFVCLSVVLLWLVGCSSKKDEEKKGAVGEISCEFSEQEVSLGEEKAVTKGITCSIPSNQGKVLTMTYDKNVIQLDAEGNTGTAGNLTFQTSQEDEFEAKLKIKGLKVGKTTIKATYAEVTASLQVQVKGKYSWNLRTAFQPPEPEFEPLSSYVSLVYRNRVWIIGGVGRIHRKDVWSSADGKSWTRETTNAAFGPRVYSSGVVFNNKMWVIGGTTSGKKHTNSVWNSSDGKTWVRVKADDNSGFRARNDHTSLVFKNRMWVIGGCVKPSSFGNTPRFDRNVFSENPYCFKGRVSDSPRLGGLANDVWSSTNGATWTRATGNAGFSARNRHRSLVFNNKMWVIGGCSSKYGCYIENEVKSDVWSSSDGVNWTEETGNVGAGFDGNVYFDATAFDNKIWLTGGWYQWGTKVWSSADGKNWTLAFDSAFFPHSSHRAVVSPNGDKLWVLPSGNLIFFNVWESP